MSASARWMGALAALAAAAGCENTLMIGALGDGGTDAPAARLDRTPPSTPDVADASDVTTGSDTADVLDVPMAADVVDAPAPPDTPTPPDVPDAPDACIPAGVERCNGIDDDCNGAVDDLALAPCTLGPCSFARFACRADLAPGVRGVESEAPTCARTGYLPVATVCRRSAGACDVDDTCDGHGDACPPDAVAPATTACRPSAHVCDAAEACDGVHPECPADGFLPTVTSCGTGLTCDVTGACNACPSGQTLCGSACVAVAPCTVGVGACARTGSLRCNDAGTTLTCSVTAGEPTPEVCDGLDNDCNGRADDGVVRACYTGPAGTASVGAARWAPSPRAWIDACAAAGHLVTLAGTDDAVADFAPPSLFIPFPFHFYGRTAAHVRVFANGVFAFDGVRAGNYTGFNEALPTADFGDAIFAFWDDLYQRDGLCFASGGAAPDRFFAAEWSDAHFYPLVGPTTASEHLTFEVVLGEAGDTIDVLYQRMEGQGDRALGASATIGLQQGDGVSAETVSFETPIAGLVGGGYRFTTVGTTAVGTCHAGAQSCAAGSWGACAGQVTPAMETCGNGLDDDCDGAVDDGCP